MNCIQRAAIAPLEKANLVPTITLGEFVYNVHNGFIL